MLASHTARHCGVCGSNAAVPQGLVAEVPPKFARAGGSRPDFGPKKSKKTHKNTHKIKIK
jgi:hypothetical protein